MAAKTAIMEEMCIFHASLPILESLLNGGKVSFQRRFFGLDFWVHYISNGLLRLFDLGTFFPGEKMHLCMIIPQSHFEITRSELLRPIFQAQSLQQHCELIGQEVLLEHAEHILRWARNVLVINDLASLSKDGYDQKLPPRWSSTDQASLKSGA